MFFLFVFFHAGLISLNVSFLFSFLPSPGEDISLSVSQVLNCRNFCNKMWQTLRFTLGVLGDNTIPLRTLEEVQQRNVTLECNLICAHSWVQHCHCAAAGQARCMPLEIKGLRAQWYHCRVVCDRLFRK